MILDCSNRLTSDLESKQRQFFLKKMKKKNENFSEKMIKNDKNDTNRDSFQHSGYPDKYKELNWQRDITEMSNFTYQ